MNGRNNLVKMIALMISMLLSATSFAQGYEIKVSLNTTKHYDTLHLKAYDGKKDFVDLQALPMAKTVTFKSKHPLNLVFICCRETLSVSRKSSFPTVNHNNFLSLKKTV